MKWINQFMDYILFFTVAICLGVFGFVYTQKSVPNNFEKRNTQLSADELVNKYMKETQIVVLKQERESIHKIKSQNIQITQSKLKNKEISPSEIPIEKQIAKNYSLTDEQSLTETFDQKTYDIQIAKTEDLQSKKEYAREFIANARKNGYHITLSEDLQVTSVQPIRKPTNQPNDNDTFETDPSH